MPYTQTRGIDGKSVQIGTFVFRKRLQGVGEIRLQSGTRDARIFKQYEVAVHDLYANGTLDALIALKDKRCSLRDLYTWWRDKTQPPPWLHSAQTTRGVVGVASDESASAGDHACGIPEVREYVGSIMHRKKRGRR